jgi:hypothetical protein
MLRACGYKYDAPTALNNLADNVAKRGRLKSKNETDSKFIGVIRAMKFIAARDFSQGLNNPLKTHTGESYIKKGTCFYIGGDTPCDRHGEGLSPDDLKIFRKFAGTGAFVPFGSDEGRQVLADIERAKTPRERRADEFKAFDRRELLKMSDKELAEWQSRHESDEPQWRLAEHEWQRRLTEQTVRATISAARLQAYIGIAAALIGALAGALLTLLIQSISHGT